jgi:hypothetical protein
MPKTSILDSTQSGSDVRAMIAERAYFKAEQRGFMPGFEMADWLEAERECFGSAMQKAAPKPRRKRKSSTTKVRQKKTSAKA